MDPRHTKYHLLLIYPLQAWELTTVYHAYEPISHPLRTVRVWNFHKRFWNWSNGIVNRSCDGGGDGVVMVWGVEVDNSCVHVYVGEGSKESLRAYIIYWKYTHCRYSTAVSVLWYIISGGTSLSWEFISCKTRTCHDMCYISYTLHKCCMSPGPKLQAWCILNFKAHTVHVLYRFPQQRFDSS